MEIRRYKDIIAFKVVQNGTALPRPASIVALHAHNLEVAEISEEAWNAMAPAQFSSSDSSSSLQNNDGAPLISAWNEEKSTSATNFQFDQKIRHLTINVTQICNLGCAYCAAGGDGTFGDPTAKISVEKTLPQLKFFVDKLQGKGRFNITFLGGEPLLYPEGLRLMHNYLQLLTAGTEITLGYNVITNGTLLTETNIEILAEMKAHLTISIDGKPEVQDRVRPLKAGGSSSSLAIAGLRRALQARERLGRILIHSVFTKEHTAVLETYRYLREFKPDAYEFTFDVTESDAEANSKFIQEMNQVAQAAWETGGEEELRKVTLFDGYFNALDQQVRKSSYCGSGKSLLSIDAKNRIFSCPLDVEDKTEQVGQDQTIKDEKLQPLQKSFIEANSCQSCWARHFCGGGCLYVHKSLTGSKNKKHDSFCERQRHLLATSVMYYQQART